MQFTDTLLTWAGDMVERIGLKTDDMIALCRFDTIDAALAALAALEGGE